MSASFLSESNFISGKLGESGDNESEQSAGSCLIFKLSTDLSIEGAPPTGFIVQI